MILAWLLLLTGLTLSAVAIYYSVVGLAAIFSAAVIPIYIMGSSLEVAKLVCASWLKANWERAPRFMKIYMAVAVVVLMIITSMGIFGFLSKAHNDQNLVSGDVQSRIAIYDEKIATERSNIDASKKALQQMDAQVDQMLGRTDTDRGAERAVQIRKNQAKERNALQAEITKSQKEIAKLQAERAPIAAEVRKVEAEVGPIKYIAKFIYGDKIDENLLEKAVTWIIILIVIVFDPLAVIMLLAAQMTFGWLKEQKEQQEEDKAVEEFFEKGKETARKLDQEEEERKSITDLIIPPTPSNHAIWEDALVANKESTEESPVQPEETVKIEQEPAVTEAKEEVAPMPLEQWNAMIEEAEKAVEEEKLKESIAKGEAYIDSEGNTVNLEETEDSKKKNYMMKSETGQLEVKEVDMSKTQSKAKTQSGEE